MHTVVRVCFWAGVAAAVSIPALEQLAAWPHSQCPDNTFFIDWGSSGMKVFLVHRLSPGKPDSSELILAKKGVKFPGVGPGVAEETLRRILEALKDKLHPSHVGGAALSTAGFRLFPDRSDATWSFVRSWNAEWRLFGRCDGRSDTDCQTLTGPKEAEYELMSMVREAREHAAGFESKFGMVSCGGASIQLAIAGVSEVDVEQCLDELHKCGLAFGDRKQFNKEHGVALFSWLADHDDAARQELNGEPSRLDHEIGGVVEMALTFDHWLGQHGTSNPCVSVASDANRSSSDVCACFLDGQTECLVNAWGSYVTRWPANPVQNRSLCNRSARDFMHHDAMLDAWSHSPACARLASATPRWGFVASMSRETQLGHSLGSSSGRLWSEVLAEHDALIEENVFGNVIGLVSSSSLLMSFLRHLRISGSAVVRASKADVSKEAMADRGFSPGWVQSCEAPAKHTAHRKTESKASIASTNAEIDATPVLMPELTIPFPSQLLYPVPVPLPVPIPVPVPVPIPTVVPVPMLVPVPVPWQVVPVPLQVYRMPKTIEL